jgi:hypothetical protein
MAAAQPLPKRRLRLTGMTELASNCGDKHVDLTNCSVRSELGFDVYLWRMFLPPNPVRHKNANVQNVPHKKQDSKIRRNQNGVSQLRLILPDPTAIGIGLRHASRALLANTEARRTAQ